MMSRALRLRSHPAPSCEPEHARALLKGMLRIRLAEERIAELYPEKEMRCPVHLCIGQEAVAVGACAALSPKDYVMSTHRSHGHYLARGGSLKALMAELYGKSTGCSGGVGGSMHLVDLEVGFLGATPILGSTIPMAVGAAWAAQRRGEGRVAMVFFGDGATEEGVFHESLNFAALMQVPVVLVCENNLYSVHSPLSVRQPAGRTIMQLAQAHGIFAESGDGNDVFDVAERSTRAIGHARSGKGPAFLEFKTYRTREHCGPGEDDHLGYRSPAECEAWRRACPIARSKTQLLANGSLSHDEHEKMVAEIHAEVEEAVRFAREVPRCTEVSAPIGQVSDYAEDSAQTEGPQRIVSFADAVREALDACLAADRDVYVMGLGVPDPKGVFRTTSGLAERHGPERVLDMPAAENGMTGVAIGSALVGMRPVMVHQRMDFAVLSMEPLVNQAAKWWDMFGGKGGKVPLTVRMLIGRGWGQGPQHAQSLQAWFAHVPGLKVVMPTTPHDAKGLLIASIEDDDPVIFLEHRWLHGLTGPVPEGSYRVALGTARVLRSGTDVTLAGVSYMSLEALRAAEVLAGLGIEAEVVDLRSIRPLDEATILESVRKTGRVLVADTGWASCGVSAEVVALASEKAFPLRCPPRRVTLPDRASPSSPALAAHYYPRSRDLVRAVLTMMGRDPRLAKEEPPVPLDVPDPSFTGPF